MFTVRAGYDTIMFTVRAGYDTIMFTVRAGYDTIMFTVRAGYDTISKDALARESVKRRTHSNARRRSPLTSDVMLKLFPRLSIYGRLGENQVSTHNIYSCSTS